MIQAKTKVCASCGRSNDSFLRTCGCGAALSEVPALRPPVTKSAAEPPLNKHSTGPVVLTKAPVEIKALASRPRPFPREAPTATVERARPDATTTAEARPDTAAPAPDLLEGEGRWRTYALATLPVVLIAISATVAHRYRLLPFTSVPVAPSDGSASPAPTPSAPTQTATAAPSGAPVTSASSAAVMRPPTEVMSKNEFVDYARSAVVLIEVSIVVKNTVMGSISGTGFFVSSDGLIATARSLLLNDRRLEQFRKISIQLEDGATFKAVWNMGDDRANDLALLRIRRKGTPFLTLSSIPKVRANTDVMVVSHPLGFEKWAVTQGTVTGHKRWDGLDLYSMDTRLDSGSSGAAVIMMDGREVIGVVDMNYAGGSMNYAARIEPLQRLITDAASKDGTPCGVDTSNDDWESPQKK